MLPTIEAAVEAQLRARTGLSAAERRTRATLAAYAMHAAHDAKLTTAKARAAFKQRFLDQVDPDHVLNEAERNRRAIAAIKAHLLRSRLKGQKKRRLKREARAAEARA